MALQNVPRIAQPTQLGAVQRVDVRRVQQLHHQIVTHRRIHIRNRHDSNPERPIRWLRDRRRFVPLPRLTRLGIAPQVGQPSNLLKPRRPQRIHVPMLARIRKCLRNRDFPALLFPDHPAGLFDQRLAFQQRPLRAAITRPGRIADKEHGRSPRSNHRQHSLRNRNRLQRFALRASDLTFQLRNRRWRPSERRPAQIEVDPVLDRTFHQPRGSRTQVQIVLRHQPLGRRQRKGAPHPDRNRWGPRARTRRHERITH